MFYWVNVLVVVIKIFCVYVIENNFEWIVVNLCWKSVWNSLEMKKGGKSKRLDGFLKVEIEVEVFGEEGVVRRVMVLVWSRLCWC